MRKSLFSSNKQSKSNCSEGSFEGFEIKDLKRVLSETGPRIARRLFSTARDERMKVNERSGLGGSVDDEKVCWNAVESVENAIKSGFSRGIGGVRGLIAGSILITSARRVSTTTQLHILMRSLLI